MRKQNRTLKPHARQELILQLLKVGGPLSITEIANRLQDQHHLLVNRKTVSRDLIEMSSEHGLTDDGGFPVRYSVTNQNQSKRHEVRLNEEHLQILSMALTGLKSFSSLKGLAIETETALLKSLPESLKLHLSDKDQSWILQWPHGGIKREHSPDVIDTLLKAIRLGCAVQGTYGSKSTAAKERVLAPIRVEISGSGLSILARDLNTSSGEIKRFVPSRFQKIKLLEGVRTIPPSVEELKPFWSTFGGFGGPGQTAETITLLVGASVGEHLLEVEYHPSQRVEAIGHDKFRVTFKVPIAWPVVRMVASFGGDVDQIEPTKLKERVYDIWSGGHRAMKRLRGA